MSASAASAFPDSSSSKLTMREKELLFSEALREYAPRVLATGFAVVGDHDAAEDVAQDVFVRFHSALMHNKIRGKPGPWLSAVAVNVALAHVRHESLRRYQPITPRLAETVEAPADVSPEDLELYQFVLREMADLPERQRLVFVLKAMEGLSYRGIGGLLGCQPSTARKHFQLARQRLQKLTAR